MKIYRALRPGRGTLLDELNVSLSNKNTRGVKDRTELTSQMIWQITFNSK